MSEAAEVKAPTEADKVQQQYAQVCTQVGDLTFKLEDLKQVQWELSKQYKSLKNQETKPETPVEGVPV